MAKKEVIKRTTPPFIAAFTQGVWEAQPGQDGGPPKYNLTAIWNPTQFNAKDQALWKLIKDDLNAETTKAFDVPWDPAKLAEENIKAGLRKPDKKKRELDGFKEPGIVFATLSSKFPFGVVDVRKNDINEEEGNQDLLYPGCLCRAKVNVYSYDNKSKGVAIGIYALQVIVSDEKRYPRLDNRTSAAEEFEGDDYDASWLDQAEESVDGENSGGW